MVKLCVIKPTVLSDKDNDNSSQIDSPLYNDILDIVKENDKPVKKDHDKAWDLYLRLKSDKVAEAIEEIKQGKVSYRKYSHRKQSESFISASSMPEDIVNLVSYYDDTSDPTIPTLMLCTDVIDYLGQENLIKWLNKKYGKRYESTNQLSEIEQFNTGEWRLFCQAYVETDNNDESNIVISESTPDSIIDEKATLANFNSSLLRKLKSIILNIFNVSVDEIDEVFDKYAKESKAHYLHFSKLDRPLAVAAFFSHILRISRGKDFETSWKDYEAPLLRLLLEKSSNQSVRTVLDERLKPYVRNMSDEKKIEILMKIKDQGGNYIYNTDEDAKKELANPDLEEEINDKIINHLLIVSATNIIKSKNKGFFKAEDIAINSFFLKKDLKEIGDKLEDIVNAVWDTNEQYTVNTVEYGITQTYQSLKPVGENAAAKDFRGALNNLFSSVAKSSAKLRSLYDNHSNPEEFSDEFVDQFHVLYNRSAMFERDMNMSNIDILKQDVHVLILSLTNVIRYGDNGLEKMLETITTNKANLSNNTICGQLQLMRYMLQYMNSIIADLQELHKQEQKFLGKDKDGNQIPTEVITEETLKNLKAFSDTINTCINEVTKNIREVVINTLQEFYGDGNTITDPLSGKQISIKEYVERISSDITLLDSLLDSAAECGNVTISILDSIAKTAIYKGQHIAQDLQWQIDKMQLDYEAAQPRFKRTKTHEFMFRHDKKGNLKEQFIMDYDMAKYKKAKFEARTNYIKTHVGVSRDNIIKFMETWESENTEYRDDLKTICPKKSLYPNDDFNNLEDYQKKYWHDFMVIKAAAADTTMRNLNIEDGIFYRKKPIEVLKDTKTLKGKWSQFKSIIAAKIKESSYDIELNRNVINDFDDNEITSLPLFYTKLFPGEKMSDISTDLSSSLQNYVSVVTRTGAFEQYINILEGARDVMQYQKIASDDEKKQVLTGARSVFSEPIRKNKSAKRTLKRYEKFMIMEVYGNITRKGNNKLSVLLSNAAMRVISLGTLALNPNTALANILQGVSSFTPELFANEFFGVKEASKAFAQYNAYMFFANEDGDSIFSNIGKNQNKNKLSLFLDKFNVLQKYDENMRKVRYAQGAYGRAINSSPMFFMMDAGEHMMQSITALSFINREDNLLVDSKNNKFTAIDAYEKVGVKGTFNEKEKETSYHLVLKRGLSANYKGSIKKIVTNEELKERAEKANENRDFSIQQKLHWTNSELLENGEISESEWVRYLSQKIVGLNNYMHGVYNKYDRNVLQYYALGRMAIMYRKYLKPALNRRFQKAYYNSQLDQYIEGFYRTWFDFHKALLKDYFTYINVSSWENLTPAQKDHIVSLGIQVDNLQEFFDSCTKKEKQYLLISNTFDNSISKKNIRMALKSNMSKHQKSNMKRFNAEFMFYFVVAALNFALDKFDDDDDDGWIMSKFKLLSRRLRTEVGSLTPFSVPISLSVRIYNMIAEEEDRVSQPGTMFGETVQLINQPITGTNQILALGDWIELITPSNYTTVIKKGKFANRTKAYKYWATFPSPVRQVLRWNQISDIYATQFYDAQFKGKYKNK